MKPIILPLDDFTKRSALFEKVDSIFKDTVAVGLIGFIKINDAVHLRDSSGPALCSDLRKKLGKYGSDAGIFLDLKLADTSGTNANVLKHYVQNPPDILTVRDSCSAKGFLELRRTLPTTKIALVSMLTDTPAEECRRRNGMLPAIKIINDTTNIMVEYNLIRGENDPQEPFDMIVCSPLEVGQLIKWFGYKFQYVVPGIRDQWMSKGQQARITSVKEALEMGATYVVMGSQMTKGNPDKNISAAESRRLTAELIAASNYITIIPNDPLATLVNCGGYYASPLNRDGTIKGPIVGYAGKYEVNGEHKNYVGQHYFNLSKAEERPAAYSQFSTLLAEAILEKVGKPDVVLGAPMGGIFLAGDLGNILNCQRAFAEKKVTKLANHEKGQKEESEIVIKRHDIRSGDRVVITEDLCNNFSTTEKIEKQIKSFGGKMVAIACCINRSEITEWNGRPVISALHIPSPQYRQDDPIVAELIKTGNVVWKPKYNWPELKKR